MKLQYVDLLEFGKSAVADILRIIIDKSPALVHCAHGKAYSVHKSGNERSIEMPGETYFQEVDLKSNEAYGVRGEVQVAAINGTTDAVCYSVIDSPGQQSGETASGTEIRMDSNEAYGTSERDRQTEETLDYDYAIL